MKVIELLEVFKGGVPTVRIIDNIRFLELNKQAKAHWQRPDEAVLQCVYLDNGILSDLELAKFYNYEVKHFAVVHEVSHKQYKERGLIPPFRPDLTAEYDLKDLKQKTYYDIYIDYLPGKENTSDE